MLTTDYDKRIAAWRDTVRRVKSRRVGYTGYYDPDIRDAFKLMDELHAELEAMQAEAQAIASKVGFFDRE